MAGDPEKSPSASWLRSVKLVAWSFLGIRSRAGSEEDLAVVNPMHVVAVGLVAALLLVFALIGLASWVVGK